MLKYHKTIYFNNKHIESLKAFNNRLNTLTFNYTVHSKKRIIEKVIDKEYFYNFMLNLCLNYNDIFEYTIINDKIEKIAYRIKYDNEKDIVLSIGYFKQVITIYFNNNIDKHYTLNINEYSKV